ncbi:hypothetical protein EU537_00660 [Candidatus Thorarchaeota archaeon]|nr:MAG: hypothetical protein EU537_00660 [Candidatus Thorarchaeota archaeon]
MAIFDIKNLDIDTLVSFLRKHYGGVIKRTWKTPEYVYGVFLEDELVYRTMNEQVILIVLEHAIENNECSLEVIPAGGGSGLLHLTWGSYGAAVSTFKEKFGELATEGGWDWKFRERDYAYSVKRYPQKEYSYTAKKCPHCGAVYSYEKRDLHEDGSVDCQNCAKRFIPANQNV